MNLWILPKPHLKLRFWPSLEEILLAQCAILASVCHSVCCFSFCLSSQFWGFGHVELGCLWNPHSNWILGAGFAPIHPSCSWWWFLPWPVRCTILQNIASLVVFWSSSPSLFWIWGLPPRPHGAPGDVLLLFCCEVLHTGCMLKWTNY